MRFEAAVSAAAAVIAHLGEQPHGPKSLPELPLYSEGTRALTARGGLMSATAMLEELDSAQRQPAAAFTQKTETIASRAARQSACLCVLLHSDGCFVA